MSQSHLFAELELLLAESESLLAESELLVCGVKVAAFRVGVTVVSGVCQSDSVGNEERL